MGGLGLKKARNQNLALLTKLGWNMIINEECLWVNILWNKYLKNHSISTWPSHRPTSHIWRSITNTNKWLEKGIKWIIGNGETIDLWKDWWSGDGPLCVQYQGPHTNANVKVRSIINDNGSMGLGICFLFLILLMIRIIQAIHLPLYATNKDQPSWVGSTDGRFSTAAAYNLINRDVNDQKGWK